MQLTEKLIDRLLDVYIQSDGDLQIVKSKLEIILYDYDVRPKETAIVPYGKTRNEVLMKRFAVAKAVAGRSPRTIEVYLQAVGLFLRTIQKNADEVRSEDIQVYIAQLMTKGRTKTYCNDVRRFLSSFYTYLTKEEIITRNPIDRVEAIKCKRRKEPAFTDMEVERMRVACRTSFETAIIETLLSTGCRAAEVCAIRKDDINGDKIIVTGKGDKVRTVYLSARALVAINAYLKERSDNNEYLFPRRIAKPSRKEAWFRNPDMVAEGHFSRESVNCLCKRVAERAGVQGAHAHRFRRTCATFALRRGMPIEMVSMMLGHEELSTTQIYLDVRENDLQIAHEKYVF